MLRSVTPASRLVAAQAMQTADRPAVIESDGRVVRYSELAKRTDALFYQLNKLGVKPESCVPVLLERSADLIAAMMAVLEAGAVYVPLDPRNPSQRSLQLIERVNAAAVISDRIDPAFAAGRPVLDPTLRPAEPLATVARPLIHPDQLAYVIHTSGSTGVPKATSMSHRGLARLTDWQVRNGPRAMRTLMFTPVSFDVTFQELFSTLTTGGCLVIVDERVRRDPDQLLSAIDSYRIERLFLPYTALQQLAMAAERNTRTLCTLKHVISAGEQLVITNSIRAFFKLMLEPLLDNHYGPTEAHLVSAWRLSGNPDHWPEIPPVGRAVDGVRLHVLDKNLDPVPHDQLGELYAAGDGIARGYLADPAYTAERFVPDPHSMKPGAVMYRTGDLVRLRPDGVMEFGGRTDDQLKMRGFRIEPAEVEHALCSHPQICEAVVGVRALEGNVHVLVAYVITDGAVIEHRDITTHLSMLLPDYMVPRRFVCLHSMPQTSTGKVDRKALAQLDLSESTVPAKTGSILNLVRSIWSRVLGHDSFEDSDDFFDVGGDSLLAAWVVSELKLALKQDVPLSLFLVAGTVEATTASIRQLRPFAVASQQHAELVTLKPGPASQVLVLIHPLGGELLVYREFVKAINTRVRVLGLRMQAKPEISDHESLRKTATRHMEQLIAIQPEGPYQVAGWSFGGVLAFEIARQLRTQGAPVGFLGLLDANPLLDPVGGKPTSAGKGLLEELDHLLAEIDASCRDARTALSGHRGVQDLLGGIVPEGLGTDHLRRYLYATRCGLSAAMSYIPQQYEGDVDLFQPTATPGCLKDRLVSELRKLVIGKLRVHEVEGDHFGILQSPLVEQTAIAFDKALQRFMDNTGG